MGWRDTIVEIKDKKPVSSWRDTIQDVKKPDEPMGAFQTGVETGLDDYSLGYLPQIKAGAAEAGEAMGLADEKPYVQRRDDYRAALEEGKREHPIAAGTGHAGALGAMLYTNPAGLAEKGALEAAPKLLQTPWGRAIVQTAANALLYAGQNPGDEKGQVDPLQIDRRKQMMSAPLPLTENVPVLKDIPASTLSALPMLGPVIGNISKGSVNPNAAAQAAGEMTSKAFPATQNELEKSVARPTGLLSEENLGNYALNAKVPIDGKSVPIAESGSSAHRLYDGASKRAQISGKAIGDFIEEASKHVSNDAFVEKGVQSGQDASSILKNLRQKVVNGFETTASKARVLDSVSPTHPKYEAIENFVNKYFDRLKTAWKGNVPPNFQELQRIRKEIQDNIRYDRNINAIQPGQEEAYGAILKEIDRSQLAELDSLRGMPGVDKDTLIKLRKDYTLATKLEDRAMKQLAKENGAKGQFSVPTGAISAAAAAAFSQDPVKAAAAFALGGLSPNFKMGPKSYTTLGNLMNATAPKITSSPTLAATMMSAPQPEVEGFPVNRLQQLEPQYKEEQRQLIKDDPTLPPSQKARRLNLLERGFIYLP